MKPTANLKTPEINGKSLVRKRGCAWLYSLTKLSCSFSLLSDNLKFFCFEYRENKTNGIQPFYGIILTFLWLIWVAQDLGAQVSPAIKKQQQWQQRKKKLDFSAIYFAEQKNDDSFAFIYAFAPLAENTKQQPRYALREKCLKMPPFLPLELRHLRVSRRLVRNAYRVPKFCLFLELKQSN